MSNIYIQEPPTSGKVLLKTTVGDIDIELWARECPKACRNFIQLCLEGYYNGTTFHRLVKGFIVQGGDPNGDGTGGESVYGHPFKDEFHSRLRYSRRGLVGMANSGKDDNASQFFFTFGPTPELENKNTLFGKVTGDTVFNMLKLEEGVVDHNERPMYAHRINSTEVLSNPFNDIVPRTLTKVEKVKKPKKEKKGVKNFGLLSFGEEAEDDEQETTIFVKQNAGKAKSLHDATDDPKLSKEPLKVPKIEPAEIEEARLSDDYEESSAKPTSSSSDAVRSKLAKLSKASKKAPKPVEIKSESESDDGDMLMTREQEQRLKASNEKIKIREEIASLKRQYQMDKLSKDKQLSKEADKTSKNETIKGDSENHYINDFLKTKEKYTEKTKSKLKGQLRESHTLELLSKFKSKLDNLKYKSTSENGDDEESSKLDDSIVEEEIKGDDWLAHSLNFNNNTPVLAKDASTKGDDWYDAYDPRNPLNKRKRGATDGSKSTNKSKSSRRNV